MCMKTNNSELLMCYDFEKYLENRYKRDPNLSTRLESKKPRGLRVLFDKK
jgi:hypothetical protein